MGFLKSNIFIKEKVERINFIRWLICLLLFTVFVWLEHFAPFILGDPGADGRVDKMSVVIVYCKIETSPWAITLTEPVPEAVELPASDLPKIVFWPISEEEQPGDSDVFLHDVVFLIDRQSCVALSTGKVSRGKFQN